MTKSSTPNPGSFEAWRLGCTCPRLDNDFGRGPGPFWQHDDCPLHGKPSSSHAPATRETEQE